jgi:hypothetical protein
MASWQFFRACAPAVDMSIDLHARDPASGPRANAKGVCCAMVDLEDTVLETSAIVVGE